MANTTNFSVRMDSDIKKQCEALYGELGMNLTTAINVFLRQSLRSGGFPFDVTLNTPNAVTIACLPLRNLAYLHLTVQPSQPHIFLQDSIYLRIV